MTVSGKREQQDILATNAALREWAAGLRAWSRSARGSSAEFRRRARLLRPAPLRVAADAPRGVPALAPIPVRDLREVLVQDHGLSGPEADRALATGLLVAGYPSGYEELAAADAFDVVEEILDSQR